MSTFCPSDEDYDYGDYLHDQRKEALAEERDAKAADMKTPTLTQIRLVGVA